MAKVYVVYEVQDEGCDRLIIAYSSSELCEQYIELYKEKYFGALYWKELYVGDYL